MAALFSSSEQLEKLASILRRYTSLPYFEDKFHGSVVEAALATIREAQVLRTYDFVDVIRRTDRLGWQVKSTLSQTPVTWKRAKIRNQLALIEASKNSETGLQALGDAVLDFCNAHAKESLERYNLDKIGYARLILHAEEGTATYFERELCTRNNPTIFEPRDFIWHWTTPKTTQGKEQRPSLHGYHKETGDKWFAWHGLSENQLHFSGEKLWWPQIADVHAITFDIIPPSQRLSLEKFIELLSRLDEV